MKKHNGMRPQDVAVLLKLSTFNSNNWTFADIAKSLQLSASEVTESLDRSSMARLVSENKRMLFSNSFLEFLVFGLKYVFPVAPGATVRGIPTAHAAPPLNKIIVADSDIYVWPNDQGTVRGQAIEPLYKTLPLACLNDNELYELLALTDAIRVGRSREVNLAIEELNKRIIPK
jgi:hypothetical protein